MMSVLGVGRQCGQGTVEWCCAVFRKDMGSGWRNALDALRGKSVGFEKKRVGKGKGPGDRGRRGGGVWSRILAERS